MTWCAVDPGGRDLATGLAPRWPGRTDPAAALAAAPVVAWPVGVAREDGGRLGLAEALGRGGGRVEALLAALPTPTPLDRRLVRATPAGEVRLPVSEVGLGEAVQAAGHVDGAWLREMDRRREVQRQRVVRAGREGQLEAALHVAMLVATERLDPADDGDDDAHVASGAQLWLLAAAVASALAGTEPDPFAPWSRLVAGGWWPVGPSGGRLLVTAPARR